MNKNIPLPALKRLHILLKVVSIVESEFGKQSGLVWRVDRGKQRAGDVAGTLQLDPRPKGRSDWRVRIDGKKYLVSRVIYYMVNGVDPGKSEIDHYDRNPLNNNINNLSLKSRSLQAHNRRKLSSNTSGAVGVVWHKQVNKWQAKLKHKNEFYSLGLHVCKIEAANAYNKKVLELELRLVGKPLNNLEAIDCFCGYCY